MSAAFKLAKKKYTQQDLRRIMHETKASSSGKASQETASKRIDSPLAKYNEAGQLTCILCNSVVRSEAVWKVHINSKQHKENIEQAKKLKERAVTAQKTPVTTPSSFKRPSSPTAQDSGAVSNKKVKGILKNSAFDQKQQSLPSDFFDSGPTKINKDLVNIRLPTGRSSATNQNGNPEAEAPSQEPPPDEEKLPEGFFDDPKADAKARNIEYKDPNDEEWDRFQKEIKEATTESLAIINEEQEESTAERQISEIDEQIRNWSRVLSLEKKKEEVRQRTLTALEVGEQRVVKIKKEEAEDSEGDEDAEDAEFDEFPDWRAKKSFKARWRENRTIFNTPNPRLMNVSLLRDNKLLHGQERRGSRMSVRLPSRQPSMASLRPHSPNASIGKLGSRRGSRGSSNASATSTRSNRSQHAKDNGTAHHHQNESVTVEISEVRS